MQDMRLGLQELANVTKAVKSNWIGWKGKYVNEFESTFADYIGMRYGTATSSGTNALHLALAAIGIKKGNKVLVPAISVVADANTVLYTGAKPIFLEANPNYWGLDPTKIEEKIDKYTKAILVVHMLGHPCDMDGIMKISKKHNLHVIEDCAQAHGAEYKGKKVGSFGIVSCFSFYSSKIITTGEGGMCLTNNEKIATEIRKLINSGFNPNRAATDRYKIRAVGFSYRMTNLQGGIGVAQVKKLNKIIKKKRWIASTYNKFLRDTRDIILPAEMPWAKNVYWAYSILVKRGLRDRMVEVMKNSGIETRPFSYPLNELPMYKSQYKLPIAKDISNRGISLPSGISLTENQIRFVAKAVKNTVQDYSN
jgi:perosamine synthetase